MGQPEVDALRRIQTFEQKVSDRLDQLTKSSKVDRVVDLATRGLLIAMPALVAFIYAIEVRSRGNERELRDKVSRLELQQELAVVRERIAAASTGPTWLRDDLSAISVKLDLMKESITKLSERVVRIEATEARK